MFEYVLPVEAASKPDDKKKNPPSGGGGKGDDDKKVVHTQAKPEKPGDDLGYDPKKIPVEDIPD
jgi:hypothetical protein